MVRVRLIHKKETIETTTLIDSGATITLHVVIIAVICCAYHLRRVFIIVLEQLLQPFQRISFQGWLNWRSHYLMAWRRSHVVWYCNQDAVRDVERLGDRPNLRLAACPNCKQLAAPREGFEPSSTTDAQVRNLLPYQARLPWHNQQFTR